ncbi:unnamed protein product [Tenebrio molitor]|nr:unnamed protein product [Tenebrio molitor]
MGVCSGFRFHLQNNCDTPPTNNHYKTSDPAGVKSDFVSHKSTQLPTKCSNCSCSSLS